MPLALLLDAQELPARPSAADVAEPGLWAFNPPHRPPLPQVKNTAWVRTPVDIFIAARHEVKGIQPSPEASRRVLIRRMNLDLLGLPPTPEDVERFINDASSQAVEKLIDRMLSSPLHGERWGRHWLDLARWAETEGYEGNTFRSSVWRYRDYVVSAVNEDKPYSHFLRQQIAGDELEPYSDENIIATGFLSGARYSHNEEDKAKQRNDILVDIANATAGVALGLTLNCAQCHDHKFDPLTIKDYYRWRAFFARGQLVYAALKDPHKWSEFEAQLPPELEAARRLRDVYHAKAEATFAREAIEKLTPEMRRIRDTPQEFLPAGARGGPGVLRRDIERALSEEDRQLYSQLMKRIDKLEIARREQSPHIWAYYSPASSPHRFDLFEPRGDFPLPYRPEQLQTNVATVFLRGDPHRAGSEVSPGWPEILGGIETVNHGGKPRAALADWLTSPTNPLVARVWVNYVWQQHFGRGLVASSGDFGTQGEKPSHPELLDWLATELVRSGWSTRQIHRVILLSSVYRQASLPNPANETLDPDNRLLWRWTPRRLEAEAIRDSALRVSGEIDLRLGGPSAGTNAVATTGRRTLYLRQIRDDSPVAQAMFDGPTAHETCHRRHVSTVPLQSLYLLNNEWWRQRAQAFAARVRSQPPTEIREDAETRFTRQIGTAFELAYSRLPEPGEIALAKTFFESTAGADSSVAALVQFCQALLNANEFIYLE